MKKLTSNLFVLFTLFNLVFSSFYPSLVWAAGIPSVADGIGGCCTPNSSDVIKGCKEGEACNIANGACGDGFSCGSIPTSLPTSTPLPPPPSPTPKPVVPAVPQASTVPSAKSQEAQNTYSDCNNPWYFTQHTQECISKEQFNPVPVSTPKPILIPTPVPVVTPSPKEQTAYTLTLCQNPGYFTQHLQECVPQLEPPKPTPTVEPTPANKPFNFFNNKESQQAAVENYTAASTLVDTQDESELASRRSLVGHQRGIEYRISEKSPDLVVQPVIKPPNTQNLFAGAVAKSGVGKQEQAKLQQQVDTVQKSQQQANDDYQKAQMARMQACGAGSKNIDCTKAIAKSLGLSEDTDPDTVFKEFQQRASAAGIVVTGTNFYDANYSLRPPDPNSTGVQVGNALRGAPEAAANFVTNNGAKIVNKIVEQQQKEIYARDVLRPGAGIIGPLPYGSFLIFTSKNADERVAALKQELEDDMRFRPDAILSFDQLTNRRKYQQYLADLTGSTNTNVEAQKNFATFGMKDVADQSQELVAAEKQLTELENKSGLPHTNTPNAVTGWTSRLDLSSELRSYYAGLTDEDIENGERDDLSAALANSASEADQQKIKDKWAEARMARDAIRLEDQIQNGYTEVAVNAAGGTVQAALTVVGVRGGGAVADAVGISKIFAAAPKKATTVLGSVKGWAEEGINKLKGLGGEKNLADNIAETGTQAGKVLLSAESKQTALKAIIDESNGAVEPVVIPLENLRSGALREALLNAQFVGSGAYGETFVNKETGVLTKIFFAIPDLKQIAFMQQHGGEVGVPKFINLVKDTGGKIVGFQQEYIPNTGDLYKFMNAGKRLTQVEADQAVADLARIHAQTGYAHGDLGSYEIHGGNILVQEVLDELGKIIRKIRFVDYAGYRHSLLQDSQFQLNELEIFKRNIQVLVGP